MPGQERADVFAGIRRFTAADTAVVARIAPQASRVTTSSKGRSLVGKNAMRIPASGALPTSTMAVQKATVITTTTG